MEINFSDFKKVKKNKSDKNQNLSNDIMVIQDEEGNYEKVKEPLEIIQITGLLTDEEEIKKIEESLLPDTTINVGEVKRGQIIWLTALLRPPGLSYTAQQIGVIKARVVDYYLGLSKLSQVYKQKK